MTRIFVSRPAAAAVSFGLASLSLFAPPASGAVTTGPGFAHHAVVAAPAGSFIGGMDALPNGNVALFDGTAILELDPSSGAVVGTLFTPPSFVFGSFVETDPSGTFLLFGESSTGTITRVPLDGSPTSVVGTIPFNFACAFDAVGAAYVAASPTFATTQVYRVNLTSGAADLILDMSGPSGPIAFDSSNALYYAEASAAFPAPSGQQTIYRFSAAKVATATGPGHLGAADGTPFVPSVTAIADLVFDDEGDLLASDSAEGTIREFDAGGNLRSLIASELPFNAITTLAFRGTDAATTRFDAFQPAAGGTLFALSTDFFSFNDLNVVTPARPQLDLQPVNPVPQGPITLSIGGGPANGVAFLLVTAQSLATDVTIHAGPTPLLLGVDVSALLGGTFLPLDAQGAVTVGAAHHGAPATIALQAVVLDGAAPVGTTNAATVVLQ